MGGPGHAGAGAGAVITGQGARCSSPWTTESGRSRWSHPGPGGPPPRRRRVRPRPRAPRPGTRSPPRGPAGRRGNSRPTPQQARPAGGARPPSGRHRRATRTPGRLPHRDRALGAAPWTGLLERQGGRRLGGSPPSTPTTRYGGRAALPPARPTTVTGQCACAVTGTTSEPALRNSSSLPRCREPSTTMRASRVRPARTGAGGPSRREAVVRRPGCRSRAPATAAARSCTAASSASRWRGGVAGVRGAAVRPRRAAARGRGGGPRRPPSGRPGTGPRGGRHRPRCPGLSPYRS